MAKRNKRAGKFIVPQKMKLSWDNKPQSYEVAIGKGKLSKEERKSKNELDRKLSRIYDLNKNLLESKDITKDKFKIRIKQIMYESNSKMNEDTGEFEDANRSIRKSLRIVSRSTAFTSSRELLIENLKKNIRKNPELRTELAIEFGDERGRIQRKKLKYDKEEGGFVVEGREGVLRFKNFKKGEYKGQKIAEVGVKNG